MASLLNENYPSVEEIPTLAANMLEWAAPARALSELSEAYGSARALDYDYIAQQLSPFRLAALEAIEINNVARTSPKTKPHSKSI
jgi:hypothetical protein